MGKTGKWLRSFLTAKTGKAKKDGAKPATLPTKKPPVQIPVPFHKEKKRWSFRRSMAGGKELNSVDPSASAQTTTHGKLETETEQKRHVMAVAVGTAAAADAAAAAAEAAAAVVQLTTAVNGSRTSRAAEEAAAIKIQTYFRSYLARKALCALKGLVKLQALVRGHLVRRQAAETLRCMQALMIAQARACAQRIQMVEVAQTISQRQRNHRRSPQHPRFQHSYDAERNEEENVKIVEMDLGEPRCSSKSRNSYSAGISERTNHRFSTFYPGAQTPSKADIQQQFSPSPSALTDISPKACSSHFEEFSFATTQSSPQYLSVISMPDSAQASIDYPFFPNYMANTKSSRAKARSQSAPRQRLDSYERQSSRRRPSVEGRNIPKGVKMQPSSSQVSLAANGHHFPWSLKLDKSSISLKDSECGSTSTVLTNTNYCRSLVAYEVNGNKY